MYQFSKIFGFEQERVDKKSKECARINKSNLLQKIHVQYVER